MQRNMIGIVDVCSGRGGTLLWNSQRLAKLVTIDPAQRVN